MNRFLLVTAILGCSSAMAAGDNSAVISNSGMQYLGNLSANQAAGDQQQQINSRVIAIGQQVQAGGSLAQKLNGTAAPSLNAKASIEGNSFSQGSGLLGVNQSAGANNQMINAVRISINASPQSIDDSALSQQNVALLPHSGITSSHGSRQVVTSDQAFTGSQGVIQVNQSAGVGNRMANVVSLTVGQ